MNVATWVGGDPACPHNPPYSITVEGTPECTICNAILIPEAEARPMVGGLPPATIHERDAAIRDAAVAFTKLCNVATEWLEGQRR